ncbi:electron transport complex subunit RsxC [Saccharospirillum sp. MSK14-1]|uniref:electron transport complex subunit RsxC n=1 Tax=Saccharospirillum sp. MSK14-1 TaxID=1897632 RepID=UPI000D39DFC0|nr:electron transport complex subunit RsxC [Saccharospirillum sp. MSK14-1]PTY36308.1 electron transport complex subunit RsxC [Saccharospirillum sp. MSK14-1]
MNAPLIITDRPHRFHGGVHPAENKTQSNGTAIEALPLPSVLVLPLRMHLGAPAEPRVSVGMTVRKGDVLADADGAISAAVHAPTSGRITAIEERIIAHESGLSAPCIVLEADGEDVWRERHGYPDWRQRDTAELIQRLRDCGLAGLGGAGFPTDVKYRNTHHAIDTLIINAAECEPYITADDRLMRERATEILEGAGIAARLVGAKTIRLGIEDNKPEALAAMTAAAEALALSLRVTVVPTKYPSGGEKQLIQLITGREVPAGGLPSDLGIICQNVGTLAAIRAAVIEDEPLIRRVTTVTGAAADRPGNYEVLIGTPIETLLNHAGVHLKKADRVIMGGPMMGFALPDITAPLSKTTNCLLVPAKNELPPSQIDNPCIRCGQCEQVCPAGLLPQQLFWAAKSRDLDSAELHSLGDCIECGACAWVCPSHIPLVHYYRYAKGEIRHEREEQIKSERARARFEARQARLEKEQQEKEARRAARAKAAAEAQARKQAEAGEASSDPVQAALERARAKRAERQNDVSDAGQPSIADLEKALELAAAKVKKANERLVAAEQEAPDTVPALQKAISKLEEKHRQAQQALDAARDQGNAS